LLLLLAAGGDCKRQRNRQRHTPDKTEMPVGILNNSCHSKPD
jgi:hypothetical protein